MQNSFISELASFTEVLLSFFMTISQAEPSTINLTIENIKSKKGTIEIGIYNSSNGFLDEGKQLKSVSKKVTGKTMTFALKLPKEGKYAFAIYHDKNMDKVCNKNFLGIPKEPYGFSKIRKAIYSKPSFKKCSIDTKTQKKVSIKLLE